ncbi:MAG: hypothetical protein N3E49_05530 [Bacteroidia bacterium]|nr:hypothetical protein [Bacteroidia bacterium]
MSELLHVPEHQARRWVRLFLDLPPYKTMRIPAEALPTLRRVREGVILHRLRGAELRSFVEGKGPSLKAPLYPDYPTLLGDILSDIDRILEDLDSWSI